MLGTTAVWAALVRLAGRLHVGLLLELEESLHLGLGRFRVGLTRPRPRPEGETSNSDISEVSSSDNSAESRDFSDSATLPS